VQGPTLLVLKILLSIGLLLCVPPFAGLGTQCTPTAFSAVMASVASGTIARRLGPPPNLGRMEAQSVILSFDIGSGSRAS